MLDRKLIYIGIVLLVAFAGFFVVSLIYPNALRDTGAFTSEQAKAALSLVVRQPPAPTSSAWLLNADREMQPSSEPATGSVNTSDICPGVTATDFNCYQLYYQE